MSFQTGQTPLPPPGADVQGFDRLRAWVDHLTTNPNPVWVREMKQSARLTRTPFILLAVTLLATLIIGSVGGALVASTIPATVGVVLFHTFFSLAFFVVTMAGPAVAANSFAAEREGKTWEALQLTGLPPGVIARGKFLSAYTSVALYIVMMAPVGAMAFLFGGVTATETVAAFVWLFVIAGLSVAFGMAISSKMESLRGAILVTLFLALMLVPTVYMVAGVGGSVVAHEIWPLIPEAHPVWLPQAYARAPLGWEYLGALVAAPLVLVTLPGWFLYEATVANLTSITDDRSTGLRRWFLVSTATLSASACVLISAVPSKERGAAALICYSLFFLYLAACVFVFQGEPVGPSRRVKLNWQTRQTGALGRALGPGVMPAARAMLLAGGGGVAAISATTAAALIGGGKSSDLVALGVVAAYGSCFFLFLVGFGSWLRVRTGAPGLSRILLVVVLFFAAVGPWVLAAMTGAITKGSRDMLIAAPSPFYAVAVADELHRTSSPGPILLACAMSASAWALLGLGLLGVASLRCARIIREHEKALAESDAFLRAEEAAAGGPPSP